MIAAVSTVANLGLKARAVEVSVMLIQCLPRATSSASPTRQRTKAAIGRTAIAALGLSHRR